MKKLLILIFAALMIGSCDSMLDEKSYGNPTVEEMLENEENVVLLVGQAYAEIKWLHDHWGYWGVNALASDECVCPIRMPGEHWADGGYWKNLNTHNWDEFGDAFDNIWSTTISGAILCNKLIATLDGNIDNMDLDSYNQYVAELSVLRSYYYYMLYDCFGRIPYQESFEEVEEPLMDAELVWSNLVNSLEKTAPSLPIVTDANRATNYGRVSQGMAYTLLARLYLNAESFGCTPENIELDSIEINSSADFYTQAVKACDKVIESGSYEIEDDFFSNFLIDNMDSKENIFVIVEDGNASFDSRSSGSMSNKLRIPILTLHYSHQTTWNLIEKPWNGFCARPTFLDRYDDTDVRGPGNEGNGTNNLKSWGWFVGPIYSADGTKQLQDENGDDAIIREEIESLSEATWNDGARLLKYEIDKSAEYDYAENDFVLMRYADVLYMKEEAILRGGTGVSEINSEEFQLIRKRAFAYDDDGGESKVYTSATLTLDELCDERGREFAWENIRRRDLIRFGKFNKSSYVQYVTQTDEYRNWFPIPYDIIQTSSIDDEGNHLYIQNEGY